MALDTGAVSAHYARAGLGERILEGLRASGKDPDRLVPDDLAPADQFHSGGKGGTLDLMRLAELRGDERVLDVGGGLGGPARTLASELGCQVTVLDLTEEYCQVGEMLTTRTGLTDRVSFQHGNALEMPFGAAEFDVVWTQHSSMNIPDKKRLYAEIHRVLRPGGRLALHEIMAGPVNPLHFPVPWAPDPSISFVQPVEEIRSILADRGFRELAWQDTTESSMAWFRERMAAMATAGPTPPPLGLHLSLGPGFAEAFRNITRNFEENRAVIIQAVLERS